MPLKTDTVDMLGYYDDSWWVEYRRPTGRTFPMSLGETLDALEVPFERWPVRNREERTPISSQKRAIIHERDGRICRLCGVSSGMLTVDHIIPRSAFLAEELHVADRSDNLISACWPCNEAKSNYERDQRKRMGVVLACWYCLNPDFDEDERLPYPVDKLVYCGRCGISHVPAVDGWVL